MPTGTESAAELVRRRKSAPDIKKRHRLHALSLVASGQARHRNEVAAALGVHRHRVAAGCAAYAAGGVDQALQDDVPRPTRVRRLTDTALTALKEPLRAPAGVARSGHSRPWFAEQPQGHWSSSRVYALGRGELRAKPKRPRPSHEKTARRP
jgi:hypothetical protein